jgi:3-deoxy-D-manno-octulosonate 8-phosphate phosphatase (KDO 8-P phosphatase)
MTQVLTNELQERFRRVQLLIMDCDGVLTDGRLYFGASGEELKVFHVRDGQGLVMWHAVGFRSGIISGRNSPIVEMRAKQLGVEFVKQGVNDKVSAFREIVAATNIAPEEVAFIGDDIPDAEMFSLVGLAVSVGDSHEAVKAKAHYITRSDGGRGAVREVIDLLLESRKAQV